MSAYTDAAQSVVDNALRLQDLMDGAKTQYTPLNLPAQENVPALMQRIVDEANAVLNSLGQAGGLMAPIYSTKAAFTADVSGLDDGYYLVTPDSSQANAPVIYAVLAGVATLLTNMESWRVELSSLTAGKGIAMVSYPLITGEVSGDIINKFRAWGDIRRYGGDPTGAADSIPALTKAIAVAAANSGIDVYIPTGNYYCPNSSASSIVISSHITIRGDGMYRSVLLHNQQSSGISRALIKTSSTGAWNIQLQDFAIQGDWGVGGVWTSKYHLTAIATTGNVTVTNCRFATSPRFSLLITDANKVTITGCELFRGQGDGMHIVRCRTVIASNNYLEQINDDGIAIHSGDAQASPVEHYATVTGNKFVDSQGIAVLGAKHVTINGNSLTRVQTRGIFVGATPAVDTGEGNTAILSLSIANNVIDTVFKGAVFGAGDNCYYIMLDMPEPTIVASSGYVGQRNTAGGVVQPYPYMYSNNTDSAAPVAGAWRINITGNVCNRSLAPTSNYTSYGFGQRYTADGPIDPAIVDADLGVGVAAAHVRVRNHSDGLLIQGNQSWGAHYGIWLDGTDGSAYISWQDVLIDHNIIGNFSKAGVYVEGEGQAIIDGVVFNGDPFHVHPNRVANGKWDSTASACIAVFIAGGATGGNSIIQNCKFRNLSHIFAGASDVINVWINNILFCDPTSIGYDANNIGIGSMPQPAVYQYKSIIEDGDPASATYGQVKNVPLAGASAMPTTGKYVKGHLVENTNKLQVGTTPNKYVLQGWLRLNIGSSHTLNTDWSEVRMLTGT